VAAISKMADANRQQFSDGVFEVGNAFFQQLPLTAWQGNGQLKFVDHRCD
jgi:hypothetical protein